MVTTTAFTISRNTPRRSIPFGGVQQALAQAIPTNRWSWPVPRLTRPLKCGMWRLDHANALFGSTGELYGHAIRLFVCFFSHTRHSVCRCWPAVCSTGVARHPGFFSLACCLEKGGAVAVPVCVTLAMSPSLCPPSSEPVYSLGFSPCGDYLASGSFDHQLLIWSVKVS